MTAPALSARWRDENGMRLATQVLDLLIAGESLKHLPLGTHDKRTDLRGFAIPKPRELSAAEVYEEGQPSVARIKILDGLIEFRNSTLVDLDFTGAQIEHLRFFDTTIRNCKFDAAKCRDLRSWHLSVQHTSFRRANLRGSVLGSWLEGRGNHFQDVDFSQADLREIPCQGASFADCDFSNARLEKVEFGACEFTRCRFDGPLREVTFAAKPTIVTIDKAEPGRFDDVDFSSAILYRVTFEGMPMDNVTLPTSSDDQIIIRHFPCVVQRLNERLATDSSEATSTLRTRMSVEVERLDRGRNIAVLHREELGETLDQQERARELLKMTERECLHAPE